MIHYARPLYRGRLAAALALAFVAMALDAPLAFARDGDRPDVAALTQGQPIPDAQMAHMRGRYLAPGGVVSFGINMVSEWTSPDGERLTAGATADIGLGANGRPTLSFTPNLTVWSPPSGAPAYVAPGTARVAGGNGILSVAGVGQSIQVAGNSDSVGNDAAISIEAGGIAPQAGAQHSAGTRTLTSPTGAVVSAGLGSGGMDVSIVVPNAGRALQRLGATNFVQQAQVSGDLQQVENMTTIQLRLASLDALRGSTSFNRTVGLLQGLPH